MKKITLLVLALSLSISSYAQNIVWSDDFNDFDISDWTLIDDDGDGFNWSAVQIVDADENPVGTPQLRSASWRTVPLTPDNWIITPAIDLTSASGTIAFNWQVKASDVDWDAENYTVYVATGNTITEFMVSGTSFNESTLDGFNTLSDRTLDISSFAGEATVYVAFRHFGVSDQFTMEVDNVEVDAQTILNVEDFNLNSFSHSYSKVLKTLYLESTNTAITSIEIHSILGQSVLSKSLKNSTESIDVSSLTDGVYLARVTIDGNSKTIKFIKN